MDAVDKPDYIIAPFAFDGDKNAIPLTSATAGAATLTDGFPPITDEPIEAGGIPPDRKDFNGILFEATANDRWKQAGGQYTFDATFAAAIGGYPQGAILLSADLSACWLCTVDGNSGDPDSGASGWTPIAGTGLTSITLAASNVTLTATQYLKPIIVLTGTLTSNVQVILPTYARQWLVVNNTTGAFTVTVKTAAGTGVAPVQGQPTTVYGNGTNIYKANPDQQQATESTIGVAKVATQAQANNGTDDATIITPKKLRAGFLASFTQTGYLALPTWLGGLIIQWGRYTHAANTNVTITFPLTFPIACYVAFAAGGFTDSSQNENGPAALVNTIGATSFHAYSAQNVTIDACWFALGK